MCRLNRELRASGWNKRIVALLRNGTPVYGGSAGAIVMGETLSTSSSKQEPANVVAGLKLLNGYDCLCHYLPSHAERAQRIADTNGIPVLAISECTGLIVNRSEHTATVAGSQPAFVFRPKQQTPDCFPVGRTFRLE